MPILYTSTAPEPEVVDALGRQRPGMVLDVVWRGADGSEWHLTDPSSQVALTPGLRGLEAPEYDRWTSDAPGLAGSRYRGSRAQSREVFLPVLVRGASSADWLAVRKAWDHSMSPDVEGTLEVVVAGERRYLPCRWVRSEAGWSRDPLLAARSVVGEYLEAGGVYWLGDPIVREWQADGPAADFFMTADGVFWITPSNTLGAARMDNPGDVAAWPVWTIHGPCDTASVGVDGGVIEVPFALGAGEWLRIDSRPDQQSAVDDTGADRVDDLGAVSFRRVAAGSGAELTLDATGTGAGFAVTAELTPMYRRAW